MLKEHEIWEKALGYIQDQVGSEVVETWFQTTSLGSINGMKATVVVPNKFHGDWLGRNYRQVIGEALQVVRPTGEGEVELEFVIGRNGASPVVPGHEAPGPRGVLNQRPARKPLLNQNYTFDNFVVGEKSRFAYAACRAVAEAPARAYNPLFIYGGVGLGKTHLLHSIGNSVMRKGDVRIAYVTTEQFTNEVINSIRYNKMVEFRGRYRTIDVLLIDDIQFLEGKDQTQEEFFHTFDTLYEASKQIVLSSDRLPKQMPDMTERLRTRFEKAVLADLQPPDFETRIAILRKKSEEQGIAIGDDVIQLLAKGLTRNIRELEGALIRLEAYSTLIGVTITAEMAKTILRDLLGTEKKVITLADVQEVVARRFQVKVAELKSKRRTKTLVHPRQIAMYLARELTAASFPEIGREFGGKDHTTIMHACRQIEKAIDRDHSLQTTLDSLKDEIGKA